MKLTCFKRARSVWTLAAATVLAMGAAVPASAAEVRLAGATTTILTVIKPHQAAVEKATGHTLSIVGNATGKGLISLAEGKCDASLTSEPLEIAIEAAAAAGRKVALDTLQIHVVAEQEIVFVIHPSNSVTKLSHQQIKDIHLGKITNWKQVGGADVPIRVFTDTKTGGTYAMIKRLALDGEDYGANCRALDAVKFVNDMVGESRGGIGAIGMVFVNPKIVKVVDADKIVRPLGFITIGEPSPEVRLVIDAFKAASAKPTTTKVAPPQK